MSNYTDQEVQDAVEKIVRSSVRHPTGILGDRKISVSFSDIQEAAAGVYILYFNAPFYTLLLGVKRLTDALESQASTVSSLIDAVAATDRLVTPVKDLSPLANAKAALEELEAAVSSRTEGFSDIEKVPAYRRYVQNLDGFIGSVGPNIKSAGAVVDTPSGARAKIPGLVRTMVEQHQELIRRVTLLSGAIADFSSLNLPRIAAQGVISRARDVLDQHFTELSALDENSRLDNLRSVTLDLLTQKPLVRKFGAAQAPSEFITTSGLAQAFSDEEHPAIPARRESTGGYGPYPILPPTQFIRFAMDGNAPFDFPLPISFVAELNGNIQEPYNVTTDSNAIRIVFGQIDTGATTFDIPLTTGLRTAAQIASQINAGLGASSLRCERRFFPLRYSAPVAITSLGGSNARFTILAGNLVSLGVVVGDELDVLDGPNAGTTWTITAVDPGGQFVDTSGAAPVVPATSSIEIGPAARALRLVDTDELGSVVQRRTLRLPLTNGVQDLAAAILGWFPGADMRSRPVSAQAVVDNIKASTAALSAELVFHAAEYTGVARTEPTDPTRLVFSNGIGTAAIGTGGVSVTLTILTEEQHLDAEVDINDVVVLRGSSVAADVGKEGFITAVTATTIDVTFAVPVSASTVTFEVGPNFNFGFGDIVVIAEGPNAGRYVVGEDQGVRTTASFEVVFEGTLPVPKDGDRPIYLVAQLGAEDVTFVSRDFTLASEVIVDNAGASTGADFFLDPIDVGVPIRGFTTFIRFDEFPDGVSVGDAVQLYINQYNVVTVQHVITGVEPGRSLLELATQVDSTFALTFDFGVPNPFGRIRIVQVANYSELKERCDTWLARPEQQELYFRDLARFLNPIVTNANPTVSMVNDANNHLKKLLAVLSESGAAQFGSLHVPTVGATDTLEFALESYQAPAQEPVDTLLATFRQKGADRAIDLLLEGQFSAFFNLGLDNVSYSGALMGGLRDLAREDLPIRKFNRRDTAGEKLIGSMPDATDFEFSSEDADSPNAPDIPAAPDVASPGENL